MRTSQLLEHAGWKKGPDGIRVKDGKKLKLVYQTSINTLRQKNQAASWWSSRSSTFELGNQRGWLDVIGTGVVIVIFAVWKRLRGE